MDEQLHKAIVNFCQECPSQYYKDENIFSDKWIYALQFFKDGNYITFTKIVKIPIKENEFGKLERDYYNCNLYEYQITINKSSKIIYQDTVNKLEFTGLLSKCLNRSTSKGLKKFIRKYC